MKELQNIGKKMPYRESQEYLDELIERTTEQAILEERGKRKEERGYSAHRSKLYAAAAAIVALLVFAGITLWAPSQQPVVAELLTDTIATSTTEIEGEGPIDEFLDGISDDDAQLLAYYEIEDEVEYQ